VATYLATAPNGQTFERKSSKLYTHALASKTMASKDWGVASFCGSLALAEKRIKQLSKFYGGEWLIVPVNKND
jgi:hypothetical protein